MFGMKDKRKIKIQYIVCILIVFLGFLVDIISCYNMTQKYPQIIVERDALFGENGENMKEFVFQSDGSIMAESDDPWVYYCLPQVIDIRNIYFFIDNVDPDGVWSECYFITQNSDWIRSGVNLHNGINIMNIKEKNGIEEAVDIRFDLTSGKTGASIKLNRIIINKFGPLTFKIHIITLVITLSLFIITVFLYKMRMQKIEINQLIIGLIFVSTFSFLLFVFAPLDLYLNNQEEFWFDIYDILPAIAKMFLVGTFLGIIIMVALSLLHKVIYQISLVIGFIGFICLYLQGNFFIKNLPPLDGREIIWSDYIVERNKSILLWCAITIIVLILVKLVRMHNFFSILKYVSWFMISMLLVTLGIEFIMTGGYEKKIDFSVTVKDEFEMSENKNFIILVLDALDSERFNDILNNNPEYREIFSDFTYFPNTMGAYPYTSRSIPFILSGEWFENKSSFEKYKERVYKNSNLFSMLEQSGYKLDLYEAEVPSKDKAIFRFENILPQEIEIGSDYDFLKLDLMLVGFKYLPFDLKKYCAINIYDFNLLKQYEEESPYEFYNFYNSNSQFYTNMKENNLTYTDRPSFKFIHIEGAHVPFRYDKNMNNIEDGTYDQNIEASIKIVKEYLEKLKKGNVYDNSVLIIMADHGFTENDELSRRQNPLLMVKGINEHHTMQVSNAPVSYEDLQDAYIKLIQDEKSDMIFEWKENDQRERRFLWYMYLQENHMVEYVQTGTATDISTMNQTGREFNK